MPNPFAPPTGPVSALTKPRRAQAGYNPGTEAPKVPKYNAQEQYEYNQAHPMVNPAGAYGALFHTLATMFGQPNAQPGDLIGGIVGEPLKASQPTLPTFQQFQPPPGGGGAGAGAPVTNIAAPPKPPKQYDPAANYNQQAPSGPLPGLNTGGVNPYLSDPLMANYFRMQNPLYQNQDQAGQDFYGDLYR